MDEKEIEKIIEKTVKRTIEAERKETREREARKAYNLTFGYLKHYNDMLTSLNTGDPAAGDEKNDFLELARRSKCQTAAILANLDHALEELKKEQHEKRQDHKYEVLEMYFFRKMTYEQIIEKMPMGDSTPRRWVSEMVTILSVKLFGAEAIHKSG